MPQLILHSARQVSEILRRRRTSRRLSQQQIAAKLNISQGRMSVLESDPAGLTLDRLLRLAAILDLELILRDKSDTPHSPSEW